MTTGTKLEYTPTGTPEAAILARELATVFGNLVRSYQESFKLSLQEALGKCQQPIPQVSLEVIMSQPPNETSWLDLHNLAAKDPALALQRWQEMRRAATEELQTGHRASRAMEGVGGDPWRRAQFLAIRTDLARGWQPRNGVERQLIDTLAEAQTAMLFWLQRLTLQTSQEAARQERTLKEQGAWEPPRVSEAQANDQAAAMVDRFNRIFLRTLRALRDLRRYTGTVVVQNAEQVNLGGQQVNVATGMG